MQCRIDDIEDNSKLRRGVPVAHLIYGVPATINCANYVYFLALEQCNKMENEEATKVFIGTSHIPSHLTYDRGIDKFASRTGIWHILARQQPVSNWGGVQRHGYAKYESNCPTFGWQMSVETGGLFRLAVRLMQAFSSNKSFVLIAFASLIRLLVILFH